MLALPVGRCALSIAKSCVLTFYLFMEMVVFLVVFVIAGLIATQTMGVTETLPMLYLLKWCLGLFLTMLPCIAAMWAITVLFEKPLLSVGSNLLLVIPGVLAANTPLWIVYPYCYSGYLVSCSLHDFTAETSNTAFSMFPFLPCALAVFGLFFALAVTQFGKKESRRAVSVRNSTPVHFRDPACQPFSSRDFDGDLAKPTNRPALFVRVQCSGSASHSRMAPL